MTTTERKELENIVEQKILEFFSDPDFGLKLKRGVVSELKKRIKKKQNLVPMSAVAKKYGLRYMAR
jgi:hypothetical protein